MEAPTSRSGLALGTLQAQSVSCTGGHSANSNTIRPMIVGLGFESLHRGEHKTVFATPNIPAVNMPATQVTPMPTMSMFTLNMAAILNDPKQGRCVDMFTKDWGAEFVPKVPSPSLRLHGSGTH